jgi:dTDP-4-amino-4,6-dideoxygalactose transaminase
VAAGRTHVYHLYVIRAQRRDALRERLTSLGVGTMLNYPKALPFYPAYARLGHVPADFPNAWAAQGEVLSLPMFPEMSEMEIDIVCDTIRDFGA